MTDTHLTLTTDNLLHGSLTGIPFCGANPRGASTVTQARAGELIEAKQARVCPQCGVIAQQSIDKIIAIFGDLFGVNVNE